MTVKELQQLLEMLPEEMPIEIWLGTQENGQDCYAEILDFEVVDGVLKV